MVVEWKEVALEEVADELTVGYVGPMASEYVSDGVPFLRSLNVERLRINQNDLKFITPEFHQRIQKSKLQPGDVVVVRTGKPGTCSVVPDWLNEANCSDLVIVRCGEEINEHFLAYYMNSAAMGHIAAHLVGAVQQHFNVGAARTLRLNLPSLLEQRAIVHVLGTLDNKIELNRRRNQILEAMARALFQDWFVDFGPVRAKMEGREPYLPADVWQLFPCLLNGVRKPDGWELKRVSDFLTLAYGKSLPAGKRNHGAIPVYGSGGITGFHDEALISGPAVIVGRKGTVGSLYWEDRPCFPIDTVFYVQPEAPVSFCFYLLESLPLLDMNTDAAVPGLNRENVYRLEVTTPPAELISAFARTAARFRARIAAISRENETLANLRDALLPKLISGEVRVPDIERYENLAS